MNRVTIDIPALQDNVRTIDLWMQRHGATWTFVSKALCGHEDTLRAMSSFGIESVADSRLENLEVVTRAAPEWDRWYLRPPQISNIAEVVALSEVSLNTEREIIRALEEEASRQQKHHKVVVMVELGDLREGILPGGLVEFYEEILRLEHVEVIGIGANLGCISGTVPNVDQFTQLSLYRELLELKFGKKLPVISAGSSAVLPLMLKRELPRAINHFRIGEALFLGTDLINGGILPGLRDDIVELEAEIVEIKEKQLVALGETSGETPFEALSTEEIAPGQRGYRAVLAVGQLDTEVSGLTPIEPGVHLAGASSDLCVVNLTDGPAGRKVGDGIRFRVSYGAFVRLMANPYIEKQVRRTEGVDIVLVPEADQDSGADSSIGAAL